MTRLRVIGRIVSAAPEDDGQTCRIYIGPPPDLVTVKVPLGASTPRLGQRVLLDGELVSRSTTAISGVTVAELSDASVEVLPEPYSRRSTRAVWAQRTMSQMTRRLYRYQVDGAAWMAQRLSAGLGSLLCDDPGLGKTTQTIAALCATRSYPALIVCPASLKMQWAREFEHTVVRPVVNIVSGRRGDLPRAHVHIINYDLLRSRERLLQSLPWKLIVLDEIQYTKEPKPTHAHRAAISTRITERHPVIGLTGTPIMNRGGDLWRPLHIIDRKAWPDYQGFIDHYCSPQDGPSASPSAIGRVVKTSVGTVVRLDELQVRAAPYMLRRLKQQVLVDLPPKSCHQVLVELEPASMVHYRAAEKDTIAWLRGLGYGSRADKAVGKAEAIVRLGLLRRLVAMAKLRRAVPEYLSRWFDRGYREPLVIFGYHRDVVSGIRKICLNLGLRVVGIGGGENDKVRQREVDRFQQGRADVFVASLLAAGVGLNLQRASEALFVERVFSPSAMVQAEDRVHRIGSERPVTITYLDAAHTVDERIAEVLGAKRQLINAVLSEQSDSSETSSTVDEVAEMMAR